VLLGFAQQEGKTRGGHTICWVLVAGDRADEDLGIWRKPAVSVAAAAAAVVVALRERARAGRTIAQWGAVRPRGAQPHGPSAGLDMGR